ncbi:uracil-DNA glycosylase [Glycomyces paridis]|uniref:Uracil-DNA glycosylase n=1 Tax=Glycomyces paridis TaxID=2126555 RepID=A0A4V4HP21_9ACTN|nr:uracil-DNA glycosylase [Glycomyces paridis]THV28336.1 uracil-DNA glycosylase [Glycomyces paridis]
MPMRGTGAGPFVPPSGDLARLRESAATCEGCPLFADAAATVFGLGDPSARVVVVGEQPGDAEERAGAPFQGPAGALLDRALEEAGIDAGAVYRTYAVKHRKSAAVGPTGRRVRLKPVRRELAACRPWLLAELDAIRPEVAVCLGASAAHALLGPDFQVAAHRGVLHTVDLPELRLRVLATARPEAAARLREPDRTDAYARLLADLRPVAAALRTAGGT